MLGVEELLMLGMLKVIIFSFGLSVWMKGNISFRLVFMLLKISSGVFFFLFGCIVVWMVWLLRLMVWKMKGWGMFGVFGGVVVGLVIWGLVGFCVVWGCVGGVGGVLLVEVVDCFCGCFLGWLFFIVYVCRFWVWFCWLDRFCCLGWWVFCGFCWSVWLVIVVSVIIMSWCVCWFVLVRFWVWWVVLDWL